MKRFIICICALCASLLKLYGQIQTDSVIQFIFTSDAHYGITRKTFRGQENVTGHIVNAAMIKTMNALPELLFSADSGINAGKKVGGIDYVIQGGDIANRMELPGQSAAQSWQQFDNDYVQNLHITGHNGEPAKLLIVPGNHDISNAIGFYRPMVRKTDATAMANIYNMMLRPIVLRTTDSYDYTRDKVNYSKDIGGVHFIFITLWPDSSERLWMDEDLQKVSPTTPVIIVTHDQPECEAKHFTNPNTGHTINDTDRFENLLPDAYLDGSKVSEDGNSTNEEQRGFVAFLSKHPNIKAYFHGNSNFNEYYTYAGPDNNVALHVFRVDSPMKGKYSSKDESKLSYQLVTLDPVSKKMTVRECLWNAISGERLNNTIWGASITIQL